MPVYKLGNVSPRVAPSAYVAPGATVIGNVTLAEGSSVWFGAVLRGDNEHINIGEGVNIQDGAVLHTDPGFAMNIGANTSIGHQAMLHGCTVGAGSLIGIQAVLMNGCIIGSGCLIGAGALVTEGVTFPDNSLIFGAPAKRVREITAEDAAKLIKNAAHYTARAAHYRIFLTPLAG
jgi:carbonic anhydrase/acetyltransferase-like protein (isoleucine patch superfamily)